MGWRPTVRGSVMNPNDHPHGGGEGKSPVGRPGPVTPWGKPCLLYTSTYVEPVYKEAGMRNFTNLVRTMLNDYGVYHVQFNTINKQTLIDAKAHPENYPTLMVRVAGYSVYWTDIAERVQDDIINRTEHTF